MFIRRNLSIIYRFILKLEYFSSKRILDILNKRGIMIKYIVYYIHYLILTFNGPILNLF